MTEDIIRSIFSTITDDDGNILTADADGITTTKITPDTPFRYGIASRDTTYPFVSVMPVSDVPILLQDRQTPVSVTNWDFKVWGKSASEVTEIYDHLINIFNNVEFDSDFVSNIRGTGLALVAEENRPNEIIYSRVIDCEITV